VYTIMLLYVRCKRIRPVKLRDNDTRHNIIKLALASRRNWKMGNQS
jgi:hypothetical protein